MKRDFSTLFVTIRYPGGSGTVLNRRFVVVFQVNDSRTPWFAALFPRLVERHPVSADQVADFVSRLISGDADPLEASACLTAWRMKGETAEELATAAQVMRQWMVPMDRRFIGDALDTCGTGGDGSSSFNISTAVALVVAGAGVPVVKHGNRAVSSRSGSADVLVELGVPIESGVTWSGHCLETIGFAFCFAPHFHPAMATVAPLRRRLGVRTMFNLLGPLANPAGAAYQLLGVGIAELLDPLAGALARLGGKQAYLVHGQDGLDEVSLNAPTSYRHVRDGQVESGEWHARDFELAPVSPAELHADGPTQSAQHIRDILAGVQNGPRRIVLANAAVALLTAERVSHLHAGVALAVESIESGSAQRVLDQLIATSHPRLREGDT